MDVMMIKYSLYLPVAYCAEVQGVHRAHNKKKKEERKYYYSVK
jgi:hypothetical protein